MSAHADFKMESIEKIMNKMTDKPKRQITAIVIGCGNRGKNYSQFSVELPNWLKIVGAADPLTHRRERIANFTGRQKLNLTKLQ